ncbi:MAG TPA: ABC-2 family transporter protein [Candidatus Saccharimonadales bacterium]|nr:ABC-2 family transporter protein [Candidatus Saccharimonadales bacterium]
MGRLEDARHDLRIYWLSWRTQFKAATKLRGAFTLQVVGMIINNIGLIVAWWFLFERFGTINGWTGAELIAVQGVNMLIFGITVIFSTGLYELPRYVDQGSFDSFLTKPAGILPQITSSAIEISTLGDIILGVVLIGWYIVIAQVSLMAIGLFMAACVLGVLLMWCFTLMPFLLAFYMFDSEKVSRNIAFFYLDTGIYPSGVLTGGIRLVLLTVFPGLFIGAVPMDILRGIGWELLLVGLAVAAFWLFVSLRLFRRALTRYESANLVGAR